MPVSSPYSIFYTVFCSNIKQSEIFFYAWKFNIYYVNINVLRSA